MLTIYNLPPQIHYSDIKALLKKECNIYNVTLEDLNSDVSRGSMVLSKKVTAIFTNYEDQQFVMKKINGMIYHDKRLAVMEVENSQTANLQQSNFSQSQYNSNIQSQHQLHSTPMVNLPQQTYNYSQGYAHDPSTKNSHETLTRKYEGINLPGPHKDSQRNFHISSGPAAGQYNWSPQNRSEYYKSDESSRFNGPRGSYQQQSGVYSSSNNIKTTPTIWDESKDSTSHYNFKPQMQSSMWDENKKSELSVTPMNFDNNSLMWSRNTNPVNHHTHKQKEIPWLIEHSKPSSPPKQLEQEQQYQKRFDSSRSLNQNYSLPTNTLNLYGKQVTACPPASSYVDHQLQGGNNKNKIVSNSYVHRDVKSNWNQNEQSQSSQNYPKRKYFGNDFNEPSAKRSASGKHVTGSTPVSSYVDRQFQDETASRSYEDVKSNWKLHEKNQSLKTFPKKQTFGKDFNKPPVKKNTKYTWYNKNKDSNSGQGSANASEPTNDMERIDLPQPWVARRDWRPLIGVNVLPKEYIRSPLIPEQKFASPLARYKRKQFLEPAYLIASKMMSTVGLNIRSAKSNHFRKKILIALTMRFRKIASVLPAETSVRTLLRIYRQNFNPDGDAEFMNLVHKTPVANISQVDVPGKKDDIPKVTQNNLVNVMGKVQKATVQEEVVVCMKKVTDCFKDAKYGADATIKKIFMECGPLEYLESILTEYISLSMMNIRTRNILVGITSETHMPRESEVVKYVEKYGIKRVGISGSMYVIKLTNIDDFLNLCARKTMVIIDNVIVHFTPIHIGGTPLYLDKLLIKEHVKEFKENYIKKKQSGITNKNINKKDVEQLKKHDVDVTEDIESDDVIANILKGTIEIDEDIMKQEFAECEMVTPQIKSKAKDKDSEIGKSRDNSKDKDLETGKSTDNSKAKDVDKERAGEDWPFFEDGLNLEDNSDLDEENFENLEDY